MTIRLSKCALLAAIAFYYSLVVFNNLTDYESNRLFVEHVLAMDSVFAGSQEMWRAIPSARIQTLFYISIITWEFVTAVLCWWGTGRLLSKLRAGAPEWNAAKLMAISALTLGCMMWFVAFLSIGAEWFLAWQSKMWDGREAAFRMFAIMGIVLIYLAMPDADSGPVAAAERE